MIDCALWMFLSAIIGGAVGLVIVSCLIVGDCELSKGLDEERE